MRYEFNSKELMAALQNGTDPEEIAKAFTDALNAVVKEKEEADKKASAAAMEKAERISMLEDILDEIFDFIEIYYPNYYKDSMRRAVSAEELDQEIADVFNMYKKAVKVSTNADDVISAFLKANRL